MRSRIRRKIQDGVEVSEVEESHFWPIELRRMRDGTYVPWHNWKYRPDILERSMEAVAALLEEIGPTLDHYADQIRSDPSLENRDTMAAVFLATIRHATTISQVNMALKELKGIFGHQETKTTVKRVDDNTRSEEIRGLLIRLKGRQRKDRREHGKEEEVGRGGVGTGGQEEGVG